MRKYIGNIHNFLKLELQKVLINRKFKTIFILKYYTNLSQRENLGTQIGNIFTHYKKISLKKKNFFI